MKLIDEGRTLVLLGVTALLMGCATDRPQRAVLLDDVRVVEAEELDRWWIRTPETIRFSVDHPRPQDIPCALVRTRFLIDSNGHVFNAELVSATPPEVFDRTVLEMLARSRYQPGEHNPGRTPVMVTHDTKFENLARDCDFEAMREAL